MDVTELEENLFAASDAKLHGDMCKELSGVLCKVLSIFPSLEGARPRSKSGIQALCSLHIALEKAKNILQHCSESSKLYLAITGDAVLLKFEKAKVALINSLKRVEDIVPSSIGSQILEIVGELENTRFLLDPSEKEVGDQIIALLQQGKKSDNCNDNTELEIFHKAATRLSITSSRVALAERRALKKLIDRARAEEDKRKESIVAYLLHLMRKCSKLFRSEILDENDSSQGSAPCSPTVQEENGSVHGFGRQLSRFGSMNFKPINSPRSGQMPVPPEELRCPISLQLMCDPVIIASGQTYERVCIEKWFSDGHNTCPKTQQQLPHLSLTPNNCVKGLIASWCEQNGTQIPSGPPESLDLDYWTLALSGSESTNSKSVNSIGSCNMKGIQNGTTVVEQQYTEESFVSDNDDDGKEDSDMNVLERYQDLLAVLNEEEDLDKKGKVVEKVRLLLKDDEEARIFMGANGFVEALLRFLGSAVDENNAAAQERGAMALFNLAVNNNRLKMISSSESHGPATALYLNLSCLEEAKPVIGSSQAVPFLVHILQGEAENQCKLDALHAIYNLSTYPPNISALLSSNIIKTLQGLLASTVEHLWIDKSLAILLNLASSQQGKDEAVSSQGMISSLATVLDMGDTTQQEQAVSCLLILCNGRESCIQMVLQEGVIPSLVSISVNGTTRGREKSQKLLMLFREQRQQRDQPSLKRDEEPPSQKEAPRKSLSAPMYVHESPAQPSASGPEFEPRVLSKSMSRRKSLARPFSFFWKKSYSTRQ
ncbi:hypothetical protein HID58_005551 [Brassica napus]|uniref:RING-type E3 ubiquitin transferase n=1 Tax=Brassica napus TaxID=3708 RepID=A0ABQ8E8X5_BRANA|nr:hypothetical protein HID58_005551 [Brassica napus]